jgi:hypothetical protein
MSRNKTAQLWYPPKKTLRPLRLRVMLFQLKEGLTRRRRDRGDAKEWREFHSYYR